MDGTDSEMCPVADFGISVVESSYATSGEVNAEDMLPLSEA